GIISSEGGIVFGSRAHKREKAIETLSMYNQLWDGGEWQIGRKTTESIFVSGVRLSMGVQIQPEIFDAVFKESAGAQRSIGYLARCLFSHPESTQGTRKYRSPNQVMAALDK